MGYCAGMKTNEKLLLAKIDSDSSTIPVGIFNPAIKSNSNYTQHICPLCMAVNGENESGAVVQCDCGLDYLVPTRLVKA